MVKDSTAADGCRLTQAFCSECSAPDSRRKKKQKAEKSSERTEQTGRCLLERQILAAPLPKDALLAESHGSFHPAKGNSAETYTPLKHASKPRLVCAMWYLCVYTVPVMGFGRKGAAPYFEVQGNWLNIREYKVHIKPGKMKQPKEYVLSWITIIFNCPYYQCKQ